MWVRVQVCVLSAISDGKCRVAVVKMPGRLQSAPQVATWRLRRPLHLLASAVNKKAFELFGYRRGDLEGKNVNVSGGWALGVPLAWPACSLPHSRAGTSRDGLTCIMNMSRKEGKDCLNHARNLPSSAVLACRLQEGLMAVLGASAGMHAYLASSLPAAGAHAAALLHPPQPVPAALQEDRFVAAYRLVCQRTAMLMPCMHWC